MVYYKQNRSGISPSAWAVLSAEGGVVMSQSIRMQQGGGVAWWVYAGLIGAVAAMVWLLT